MYPPIDMEAEAVLFPALLSEVERCTPRGIPDKQETFARMIVTDQIRLNQSTDEACHRIRRYFKGPECS